MSIIIQHLSFSYSAGPKRKNVLHDISLQVPAGHMVGIMGASGEGKSTLLKCIAGLYSPRTGCISAAGSSEPAERMKKISIVMQNPGILPVSIRDNITCGHPISDEKVNQAVDAAQLADWIKTLPNGLHTIVGERGNNLSGGQAQRIAIARAFAKDAPVVLLDEATSALDHDTSLAVMSALETLCRGKTVLISTHQKELLANCNSVYRLTKGYLHDFCTVSTI